MEKRIPVKTLYLLIVISLGLIGLGIGSTLAVFTATIEIDNPIVFESNLSYNSGLIETISVTVPAGETISDQLNVTNSTSDILNYVVWYNNNGDIEVGTDSGSPVGVINGGASTTVKVSIRNNSEKNITVLFGISSSASNVTLGEGMTIVSGNKLTEKPLQGATLYITNLYLESNPTKTVQGSNTYYASSSTNLMNDTRDSAGNATNDIAKGNIRYYGANPNNYIYFNCTDYSNQNDNTCEKWRIIGVVDGKVKIMRDESIGKYVFDYTSTGTTSKEWENATLRNLLNDGYYNNKDGVKYYNGSTSATTINFATSGIGITDATRENNLIAPNNKLYINKISVSSLNAFSVYKTERTGSSVSRDTISIVMPSDYAYASDLSICSNNLLDYGDTTCSSNNWMLNILTGNNTTKGWLLRGHADTKYPSYVWAVNITSGSTPHGKVNTGNSTRSLYNVVPTLFLNPEVDILEGDGTSDSPYKLDVKPSVTDISNFTYYLGDETPTLEIPMTVLSCDEYCGNDIENTFYTPALELADNEVVLTKYNGSSNYVNVPDKYIVNGKEYNVVLYGYEYEYSTTSGYVMGYNGVFAGNDYITDVILGKNIKSVTGYMVASYNVLDDAYKWFEGCTSLERVPEIPNNITSMFSTFDGCENLEGNIRINSSDVNSLHLVFYGTEKNITVEVPAGSTTYDTFIAPDVTGTSLPNNITLKTFE